MKLAQAMKLIAAGGAIVALFHALRGNDFLTGLALTLLFALTVTKLVCAFLHGKGGPPGGGGSGRRPPDAPVTRPPGGRPPALSAEAGVRHESAI